MPRAEGTFDVTITPQSDGDAGDAVPGRMLLEKRFHGDLEGTGRGQMLAAGTAVKGSAGYVAIETFSGTLHGMRGGFVLQHHGIMDRGTPALSVMIVPDSGTDALTGVTGRLDIIIAEGKHSYVLDYRLTPASAT